MEDNYSFDYIDAAKKFIQDNPEVEELYITHKGKNFSFCVYPHKEGYIAAHPCCKPKDICCYPPEHGCCLLLAAPSGVKNGG